MNRCSGNRVGTRNMTLPSLSTSRGQHLNILRAGVLARPGTCKTWYHAVPTVLARRPVPCYLRVRNGAPERHRPSGRVAVDRSSWRRSHQATGSSQAETLTHEDLAHGRQAAGTPHRRTRSAVAFGTRVTASGMFATEERETPCRYCVRDSAPPPGCWRLSRTSVCSLSAQNSASITTLARRTGRVRMSAICRQAARSRRSASSRPRKSAR
jgi:hypothetical protein